MKITLKGLLLILFILTGCSSLPSRQEMEKQVEKYNLPASPKDGQGLVYIVRPSELGTIVRFNVFLDDQEDNSEMGWNRGNQHLYFYVSPGEHTIHSKAENWADIKVNVTKNSTVFIEQEAEMGFIMARNSLKRLDSVTGKYHVMKTGLGHIIKTSKEDKRVGINK